SAGALHARAAARSVRGVRPRGARRAGVRGAHPVGPAVRSGPPGGAAWRGGARLPLSAGARMTLPPLANLFAAHDPDPLRLADLAADLEASGEFAAVWRPAPGWVAAAAPLPGGPADQFEARHSPLAFVEGREGAGDAGFIRFDPDGVASVTRSCGGLVP